MSPQEQNAHRVDVVLSFKELLRDKELSSLIINDLKFVQTMANIVGRDFEQSCPQLLTCCFATIHECVSLDKEACVQLLDCNGHVAVIGYVNKNILSKSREEGGVKYQGAENRKQEPWRKTTSYCYVKKRWISNPSHHSFRTTWFDAARLLVNVAEHARSEQELEPILEFLIAVFQIVFKYGVLKHQERIVDFLRQLVTSCGKETATLILRRLVETEVIATIRTLFRKGSMEICVVSDKAYLPCLKLIQDIVEVTEDAQWMVDNELLDCLANLYDVNEEIRNFLFDFWSNKLTRKAMLEKEHLMTLFKKMVQHFQRNYCKPLEIVVAHFNHELSSAEEHPLKSELCELLLDSDCFLRLSLIVSEFELHSKFVTSLMDYGEQEVRKGKCTYNEVALDYIVRDGPQRVLQSHPVPIEGVEVCCWLAKVVGIRFLWRACLQNDDYDVLKLGGNDALSLLYDMDDSLYRLKIRAAEENLSLPVLLGADPLLGIGTVGKLELETSLAYLETPSFTNWDPLNGGIGVFRGNVVFSDGSVGFSFLPPSSSIPEFGNSDDFNSDEEGSSEAETTFPGFGNSAEAQTTFPGFGNSAAQFSFEAQTTFPGFGHSAAQFSFEAQTTFPGFGHSAAQFSFEAQTTFPGFGNSASAATNESASRLRFGLQTNDDKR
eukprot:TRINITY_DN33690_c0_g1_i1.p1 TRINITY_DN33690_c0_g1~~TRINITY_DN33690_c0_g1_i1.p1  ORF type:complete len:716 (-),score=158.34 TRINITY_DN33690_c0_g1_i1:41-2029(-)